MYDLNKITVIDIQNVLTIPTYKGRFLNINCRPTYALSFSKDTGKIIYEQNGKQTVSHHNNAVILPMGASYSLKNKEGGDFPIINFTTTTPFTEDFISIELNNPYSYLKDFERMERLWKHPNGRCKVLSLLYDMLYRLSRESETHHPLLFKAEEYLIYNLHNPTLSNNTLAAEAKVSEVYFRKLFKEHYGITPKQYILNARINLAKELLSEGACGVALISEKCGFNSVYHFSRIFKNATGLSPTEYAKKET